MGIGLGIFLIAVGAILTFAVETQVQGLNLDAVGWILMLAGLGVLLFTLAFWSYRRRTRVVERTVYPPVVDRIVERRTYPPRADQLVEREVPRYPVDRIVERRTYPPRADQVVEREVPRYPVDRIVEHDVYDDPPP